MVARYPMKIVLLCFTVLFDTDFIAICSENAIRVQLKQKANQYLCSVIAINCAKQQEILLLLKESLYLAQNEKNKNGKFCFMKDFRP